MLKFSVLFGFAVIFCASHNIAFHHGDSSDYHREMDIMEIISRNGYPVENITVETEDGYLLDLIRIRHGLREYQNLNRQYQGQQYQGQQYQGQQYQGQQYQGQQYQGQQNQGSQYQNPQYQGPQYQGPQYQGAQYHGPQGPQYQGPQYQGQQYQGQQYPGSPYQNQQYYGQQYQGQQNQQQLKLKNNQYQSQESQGQQYQDNQNQSQEYQGQNNQNQPNYGQQYQGNQYQNQQYQGQQYNYSQSSAESAQYNLKHQQSNSEESSESQSSSGEQQGVLRPVVLLMHGLLSSAEDFVLGDPTEGLAYIMADHGYDVFLGNVRGSKYGRKHTVLNPERDSAFWRFCWDDMGMRDLPAIIDKMLKITRQEKIYYVGHSQGSTVFYVMASEKPEYNDKIHSMVTLGPVAFMGHATNKLLRLVSEKQSSKGWVVKHLGSNEFKPSWDVISEGGERDCMTKRNDERMCKRPYFLLNGYNSDNLNTTSIRTVMDRRPSGTSTRQILHYGQLIKTGRFVKYCEDCEAEDYNLDKIRVPMGMYYTPRDSDSVMEDVEKLTRKLRTLKQTVRVERLTNNLDLMYGKDVADIVYRPMLKMLQNIDNNPGNNMY